MVAVAASEMSRILKQVGDQLRFRQPDQVLVLRARVDLKTYSVPPAGSLLTRRGPRICDLRFERVLHCDQDGAFVYGYKLATDVVIVPEPR